MVGKNIQSVVGILIISVLFAACGSNCGGKSFPQINQNDSAKVALEKTLRTIKGGNYKQAIAMMEGADIANQSDKEFAEKMLKLKYENRNGLKDWQIVGEDYSEQDKMTLFNVAFSYGDGKEKDFVLMVWTTSGWRMRDMLFSVIGRDEFGRKMMEFEYTMDPNVLYN